MNLPIIEVATGLAASGRLPKPRLSIDPEASEPRSDSRETFLQLRAGVTQWGHVQVAKVECSSGFVAHVTHATRNRVGSVTGCT